MAYTKKTRSPWRKYFKDCLKTEDSNDLSAVCIICDKVIKTSGNTTNQRRHLQFKHPEVYQMEDEKKPPDADWDESFIADQELPEKLMTYNVDHNEYNANLSAGLRYLLTSSDMSDITLAVEGKYIKAHQMVLSMFSTYFRELFHVTPSKNIIFYMKNVKHRILKNLLTFMYEGKVDIPASDFQLFVETATELKIKGVSADARKSGKSQENANEQQKTLTNQQKTAVGVKLSPIEQREKRPLPLEPNKVPLKTYKRKKVTSTKPLMTTDVSALPTTSNPFDDEPESVIEEIYIKKEPDIDITDNGPQFGNDKLETQISLLPGQEQVEANAIEPFVDENLMGYLGPPEGIPPTAAGGEAESSWGGDKYGGEPDKEGSSVPNILNTTCSDYRKFWTLPIEGQLDTINLCISNTQDLTGVIWNNYRYYGKIEHDNYTYWTCTQTANHKCNAKILLSNEGYIALKNEHTHECGKINVFQSVQIVTRNVCVISHENFLKYFPLRKKKKQSIGNLFQ